MRSINSIRLILVIWVLMGLVSAAPSQTASDSTEIGRAVQEFDRGNPSPALSLVETVLSRSPDDVQALFHSPRFNFHRNNLEAARGRLERLIKLSGSYFAAWELLAQVTQAQGDLARRNEALEQVKVAIHSALDPEIRRKGVFIRERIPTPAGDLFAADYFERRGTDFTRYQFGLRDTPANVDLGLVLRTDTETTRNWEVTALLAPEKQLFHLDLVDPLPGGGQ